MASNKVLIDRMRPIIDAMSDGPEKAALMALVQSQDVAGGTDLHPRERARNMRRLLQLDSARRHGNDALA